MARRRAALIMGLVLCGACGGSNPAGSGGIEPTNLPVTVSQRLAPEAALSLLGHQRRWLTDLQVAVRAAASVVDTLAAWWRSAELASLDDLIELVDSEVQWFAARHLAPRWAADWSPTVADDRWARRYDDLVGAGLADRDSGNLQGRRAVGDIVAALQRGDLAHPEIALLVSTLVGWLTEVRRTPA